MNTLRRLLLVSGPWWLSVVYWIGAIALSTLIVVILRPWDLVSGFFELVSYIGMQAIWRYVLGVY